MATPTTWGAVSNVPVSGNALTDSLIWGTKWGGAVGTATTVTYSFPSSSSYWSTDATTGYVSSQTRQEPWTSYQPLNPSEQAAFSNALQGWANVANVSFAQTPDNAATGGDIRVAFTGAVTGTAELAHAYYPLPTSYAGDVWLNTADRLNTFIDPAR